MDGVDKKLAWTKDFIIIDIFLLGQCRYKDYEIRHEELLAQQISQQREKLADVV